MYCDFFFFSFSGEVRNTVWSSRLRVKREEKKYLKVIFSLIYELIY